MSDLVYRFDLKGRHKPTPPRTSAAAIARLEEGNRRFVDLIDGTNSVATLVRFDADDLGIPNPDGSPPAQKPFAAVLSCADARVPVEMVLGQTCNDLFVVRVAGNVLGSECLGSLDYAVSNMSETIRVAVVLGHSNCGAVIAAVKAFNDPSWYLNLASSHPLRTIVDRLQVPVRSAHCALEQVYGMKVSQKKNYQPALVHTAVAMNAAMQAATLKGELGTKLKQIKVVYGVYDLATRQVKVTLDGEDDLKIQLSEPPKNDKQYRSLAERIVRSTKVSNLLA